MDRFRDFKPLVPDDESSSVEGDLVHEELVAVSDETIEADDGADSRRSLQSNELGYSVLSSIEPGELGALGSGERPEVRSSGGLIQHLTGHDTMYGEPIACSTGFSFFHPEIIDTFNSTADETLKNDAAPEQLSATKTELSQHTISGSGNSREGVSHSPVDRKTKENDALCRSEFRLLSNDDKRLSLSQHSLDSQGSRESGLVSEAAGLILEFDSLVQSSTNNRINASQLQIIDAYSDEARGKSPDHGQWERNLLPQFSIVDMFVGTGIAANRHESGKDTLPQFQIVDAVYGSTVKDPFAENLDSNFLAERLDLSSVKVPRNRNDSADQSKNETYAEGVENKSISAQVQKISSNKTAQSNADTSNSTELPHELAAPCNDRLSTDPRLTSSASNPSVVPCAGVNDYQCKDDAKDLPSSVGGLVDSERKQFRIVSGGDGAGDTYQSTVLASRQNGGLDKSKKPQILTPMEFSKSSDSNNTIPSLTKQQNANNANDFSFSGKNNHVPDAHLQSVKELNNFASSVIGFSCKSSELENPLRLSVDVLHTSNGDASFRIPIGSSTPIVNGDRQMIKKIQALRAVGDFEERSDSGRASRASTAASLEPDFELERNDLKPTVECISPEENFLKLTNLEPDEKHVRNTMSIRDELCLALKKLSNGVAEEEIANIAKNMIGKSGVGKSSSCSSCTSLSPAVSVQTIKQICGDVDLQSVGSRSVSASSLRDSAVNFKTPTEPSIASVADGRQSFDDLKLTRARREPIGATTEELKAAFPIFPLANSKTVNVFKKEYAKEDSFAEDSEDSDVEKVRQLYQSYLDEGSEQIEMNEKTMVEENRNKFSENVAGRSSLSGSVVEKVVEAGDWKKTEKERILSKKCDQILTSPNDLIISEKEKMNSLENPERSSFVTKKLMTPESFAVASGLQLTSDVEIAANDDLLASSLPGSSFSGSEADGLSEDVKRILIKYGHQFPKFVPLQSSNLNAVSKEEIPGTFSKEKLDPRDGTIHLECRREAELNGESSSESSDDTLGKRVSALLAKTNKTIGLSGQVTDSLLPLKSSSGQSSVTSSRTGSMDYDVLQRELHELEMSLDSMKKCDFGSRYVDSAKSDEDSVQKPNESVFETGQLVSDGLHHLLSRKIEPVRFDVDGVGGQKDDLASDVVKSVAHGTEQQTSAHDIKVALLPSDKNLLFFSGKINFTDQASSVTCDSLSNTVSDNFPLTEAVATTDEDEMDRLSRSRISSLPASLSVVDHNVSSTSQSFLNVMTKRGSSYGGISFSDFPEIRSLDGAEANVTLRRGSDLSRGSTEPSSEVELERNLEVRNVGITVVDGGDNQSTSGYSGSGSLARSEASLGSAVTVAGRFSALSGIAGRVARTVEFESDFGKQLASGGFTPLVKKQMELKRNLLLNENQTQRLIDDGFSISTRKAEIGDGYEESGETKTASNVGQEFVEFSSGEFQPVDFRVSSSLPAANRSLYRDSNEQHLKSGAHSKKVFGGSVSGDEAIRKNEEEVRIGSMLELEVSVSSKSWADESSTQIVTTDQNHESDSFADVPDSFDKKSTPDRPIISVYDKTCDDESKKVDSYKCLSESDKFCPVKDISESANNCPLNDARKLRDLFVSPMPKPYSFEVSRSVQPKLRSLPHRSVTSDFNNAGLRTYPAAREFDETKNFNEFLNDSHDSNRTLVSDDSKVTDEMEKAPKSVGRMCLSGDHSDQDSQSASQDDPVSSNGALRTSLTTVTSLRDSTDSERNSVLDHVGTNAVVNSATASVVVPYRPANSNDVYYVDSGPEEGSHSAAVSDATVESTHPSSDDARAPNFPVHVLGSRTVAPMDVMTQKKKTVTDLSAISERSEIGNLSSSKINYLAEKTRRQELEQLQEKTKNWVIGISTSLPDMCTPLKADKTSHACLSESEILAGSRDKPVTGTSANVESNQLPISQGSRVVSYRKDDQINSCQLKPDNFAQTNTTLTASSSVLPSSEGRDEKSRSELKMLNFREGVTKEQLRLEVKKLCYPREPFSVLQPMPGGDVELKHLLPEQRFSRLEDCSGMTLEIQALIEKYAAKEVSEKSDGVDKKELLSSQALDSFSRRSFAAVDVEQSLGLKSTDAKIPDPVESKESFPDDGKEVSQDEFRKRLWERFHEAGGNSSSESEYNDRRVNSSVKRLVSLVNNPTQHLVKHLQSEREEQSRTDDELMGVDLSRSHSVAGVSMRSVESCRTYTIEAGQGRSRGKETASGPEGKGTEDSNGGQGHQTDGKDSSNKRIRSSGSNLGVGGQSLSANGAGEKSSSDDDRPRRKTLPDWQEFGDTVDLKRSMEKNESKRSAPGKGNTGSVLVKSQSISKRAWMIVDDDILPVVPEDTVLETASSDMTQSSLDEAGEHAMRATRLHLPDDPKLLKLQQKIAHQKEKYRRAYIREHRRKLKIAELEMRYKAEAGVETSAVTSSLESFSQPPSAGVSSSVTASASDNSTMCWSCSESDAGACLCVRLRSSNPVMKQSIREDTVTRGKAKASPPQKKLRESSPAIVLDLREVDYSEGGRPRRDSSPRARRPHASHTRVTSAKSPAKSPSKSSKTPMAKSPVRRTVSHASKDIKSPLFAVTKSGTHIVDMTRKNNAHDDYDDDRRRLKNKRADFGMTFPTPREEVEKCSKGIQTSSRNAAQSPRRPYRGSKPHDVGVISIPVTGKMKVKNPRGNLHLHGTLISNVSSREQLNDLEVKTKSHKVKPRKPVPRGIAWFVPLKETASVKNQKSDHLRYCGVGSDWMSDELTRFDNGNKENSSLFKLSSVTVTKETSTDFDQVTTVSDRTDVLRENTLNSMNNSNSTKIISKSDENFLSGNGETVIPSLQQCFRARMQAFISRSRQRENRITLRAEERRMKQLYKKQRMQLFGNALKGTSASRRDPISEQLFKPQKRWFTKQQMKTMTHRRYRNLPEVMKMVEEKQKTEQFRANRQRVQVFKQRILNHVLGEKNKRIAA